MTRRLPARLSACALAGAFAGLFACSSASGGSGGAEPVVLAVANSLHLTQMDTAVLVWADGQVQETVGSNRIFLDWRRGEVAILDSGKRAWYRAPLPRFEKDMAEVRRLELERSRKLAGPLLDSAGGSLLPPDSCDAGPRGPFRKTFAEVAKATPIAYPERLSVVPEGGTGDKSRAYLIKTQQGDSLGEIWIQPGKGLSALRDFDTLKAAYYRLWKTIEPSTSHSAAGFNVLAHPDVMELYRHGLPVRAVVWGTGTCPEQDESTFRPLSGTEPDRFPDKAPAGFRKAPLTEVW